MVMSAEDQKKRGLFKSVNGQQWFARDDGFCGEVRFAVVNNWQINGHLSAMPHEAADMGGPVVALELEHWDIPLVWMPAEMALELGKALVEVATESLNRQASAMFESEL